MKIDRFMGNPLYDIRPPDRAGRDGPRGRLFELGLHCGPSHFNPILGRETRGFTTYEKNIGLFCGNSMEEENKPGGKRSAPGGLFGFSRKPPVVEGPLLEPETGAEQEIVAGEFGFDRSTERTKIRIGGGEITNTESERSFWAEIKAKACHQLKGSYYIGIV